MALGMVLSVAQTLFAALQCPQLKEICSVLGYKPELENLERTVSTIKAVLLDAESKQEQEELSHQQQLWIQELKDALYDADDLLDEFVTLADQKKLVMGGNASEKVRLFFSRFNPLIVAHNMSRGVANVRKKLDAVACNHTQFGFKLECQPIRRRREESCSYVYAQNIIGRDDDKERIIGMLLDSYVQRHVSFLTIVGVGGLGKTALAQLVYNDPRIEKEFPLRLWTCVSDENQKHLDIKVILSKILESTKRWKHKDLSMDHLQRDLQEELAGKKYLLVLDDVWNEDGYQWHKFVEFLMVGQTGSWILVTTRSRTTATIVGDEHIHYLKGLSEQDSWCLFVRTAFGQGQEQARNSNLVEIGQEIIKRCANVPLAIRVVGSLLYGHGIERWLSFQSISIGKIKRGNVGIEPILKLSYHNLESPLKACFSYCALFPKDFVIDKEMLINLWMAQGYIIPLDEGQSIEDAGEEYFSILLRRCFFQDIEQNEISEIVSCKMHDLMHDIAQEVAGKEIYATNSITSNFDKRIRHISHEATSEDIESSNFSRFKIRTYLQVRQRNMQLVVGTLVANWMYLRALDLSASGIQSLPSTIGKLQYLRYLDLSENFSLELLPKSITELHNLQTLNLQRCKRLKWLPKYLNKLVKLRFLDISECWGLTHMPWGMGRMKCLQKLTMFVVGKRYNSSDQYNVINQLENLKSLEKLKGHLELWIPQNIVYLKEDGKGGGYLISKQHLSHIIICIPWKAGGNNQTVEHEEELLEDLQPHRNLKKLSLSNYSGRRMPSWAREDNLATFLPNLVSIRIALSRGLQHLASLGKLRHLKSLLVSSLKNMEYIENTRSKDIAGASESESFFPSLEELRLYHLPKLRGWWTDDEVVDSTNDQEYVLPSFPRLYFLRIAGCPKLACIPLCPSVRELSLTGKIDERLQKIICDCSTESESGSFK